ncbi:MAG TPA: hypothetical protein PLU66_00775 [Trueperaceae bacterium]|nr:hypothetical protein [Trueperaceae bacterium]HRQ09990.1 hypothetical protein [Trueperaceae bacterium]
MMNLEDVLAGLWSRLPGCRVVAVVGMDGLLVERHPNDAQASKLRSAPGADELERVAADLTSVLTIVAGEMSQQLGARIDELVALSESGGYLARRVNGDLFLFVVVGASADLGSVRRLAAEVASELAGAFA